MIEEIFPSLFAINVKKPTDTSPCTYFLKRDGGNILFATKQDISEYVVDLANLGGVQHILLGDRHHASAATAALAKHFRTVLSASEIEAKVLSAKGIGVGRKFEFKRQMFAPDLEILPTPGHTQGAFSYLWSNNQRLYLFVGDTIVPVDDEWQYWVSKAGQQKMLCTIQLLSEIKFNVILSNSFAAKPTYWMEVGAKYRMKMFKDITVQLSR